MIFKTVWIHAIIQLKQTTINGDMDNLVFSAVGRNKWALETDFSLNSCFVIYSCCHNCQVIPT